MKRILLPFLAIMLLSNISVAQQKSSVLLIILLILLRALVHRRVQEHSRMYTTGKLVSAKNLNLAWVPGLPVILEAIFILQRLRQN